MNLAAIHSTTPIVTSQPSILCIGMGWFPIRAGGLNRYLYGLSSEFARQATQVEVCGLGLPEQDLNIDPNYLTLTNLADPNLHILKRLFQVGASLSKAKIRSKDAINLHFALYSIPFLNNLPHDIPVTFHFHGPWALECQQEGDNAIVVWLKKQIELRVYRRCDRFIVLSKAFGEVLHQEYHIPWDKIHIIPGGVDTDEFKPTLSKSEARAKLGWDPNRKILFTPRRLVHRMGLDRLLEAMVEVRKEIPDVWLGIAGKGPLSEQLEQQIQDRGLQDHAELLGFVPDELLSVAYQAADITVVPSISWEGFGLILVESLACGTPAISTPIGGMPEILQPLDPNLVTESIEIKAIADRIIQFLSGQIPLPTRETCRNYAVDRFDWQHIAPQVQQVLLAPKTL
jgi:glycosyltransferase involved in cell wall biosynthesis